MLAIGVWGSKDCFDCCVVCEDLNVVAIEIVAEVGNSPHYCQGLQLHNGVVPLRRRQGSAGIGNWVDFPILLGLRQYCTKSVDAGIGLKNEAFSKIWISQDWGGHELAPELVKGGLTTAGPLKGN